MSATALPPAQIELGAPAVRSRSLGLPAVLWLLAGLTLAGAVLRFATLGLQGYHHDEVITAARVLDGSFGHMLHEVRASESNPPLYYVLAWFWAHLFGLGEVGLRSLSALFGVAVIPVGYLIGSRLASRPTGLVLAGLLAFNPMLIWYSQEARSYALLIFFGALSMYFFVSALDRQRGADIGLWALASALALCSHYFAVFLVGIEAIWLALALRSRWRSLLPAFAALLLVGIALLPLLHAQINSTHIGWISNSPLATRVLQTGASFLTGETGSVIGQKPRNGFAVVPVVLIAAALLANLAWGSLRERRAALLAAILGLGVVALAALAALAGKDYLIERNLLPALVPLAAAVAIGCTTARARRLGLVLAVALCAYWLAFDLYVTQTPSLQRPEFRDVAERLGPPRHGRRAIVGWKLLPPPFEWYLKDGAERMYSGAERLREVDIVAKREAAPRPVNLPRAFHLARRVELPQFTVSRYVSRRPVRIHFKSLHALPTGFDGDGIVLDGPLAAAPAVPRARIGLAPSRVAR